MNERAIILACYLAVFSPKTTGSLGSWMAKNIILRPEENPSKPGPYDPAYSPAVGKLLDLFYSSSDWWELIVQKSGQSAMSFHVLGQITRMVKEEPANVLYVMDSRDGAQKISTRLQAFLEDSPATAAIHAACEEEINTFRYKLPGMELWLAGAGSAGQIASSTVMLGVGDEVDKHRDHKTEANTLDLLRTRLKEQTGSRLIAFSTPTVVTGQIHKEFRTGSQHRYHVPCPHCGEMQPLEWDRVRFAHCKDLIGGEWDLDRVLRETYYACRSCDGEIRDRHKRDMVIAGEWRPTHFKTVSLPDGSTEQRPAWEPGKLSAHYSDLYSQNENVSFGRLAIKFLNARFDPMKLRDFNQNNLGLPDEDNAAEVTDDKILALCGPYRRQQGKLRTLTGMETEADVHDRGTPLPIDPILVGILADTQDANSKWTLQAFAENGDQYVIDWGECLDLVDLDELFTREILTATGTMFPTVLMIDEGGHRSFEVRQFTFERFPRAFSSRGAPGTGATTISLRDYRIHKSDAGSPTVPVLIYDDATFRRELYVNRIARFDKAKAEAYGKPRLFLPANLEPQFTDELKKQRLIRQPGSNRVIWDPNVKGDDWGDTVKMGGILFAYLGPELIKAAAMDRQLAAAL